MTFKQLKKWCKEMGYGFYPQSTLQKNFPEVYQAFKQELEQGTNRIGCYVYHSHVTDEKNGGCKFVGMSIGYYVRSKNPFSWKFRRTYGNH